MNIKEQMTFNFVNGWSVYVEMKSKIKISVRHSTKGTPSLFYSASIEGLMSFVSQLKELMRADITLKCYQTSEHLCRFWWHLIEMCRLDKFKAKDLNPNGFLNKDLDFKELYLEKIIKKEVSWREIFLSLIHI